MVRFSCVNEDEISGFLKTRDGKNEVFLTDFAAKGMAGGTIEYLTIGEERIRIAKGNVGSIRRTPMLTRRNP